MYSPQVTKRTLDRLAPKLAFDLKPRSIAECNFYRKHFDSYLDRESGELPIGFEFSRDEVDYIQSERLLCKYDFRYWANRYGFIESRLGIIRSEDSAGIVAPIAFNLPQNIVLDVWADMEERQLAIMIMEHKARQLGVSTLTELAICHRVIFYKHVNALIAAATPDTTRKMSKMTMRAITRQPYWLIPEVNYYKSGETLLDVPELDSAITLQHGAQYTGMSRGDTPNVAHISEVSSFNSPEDDIDSSLLQAMHEDPTTFLVLESTAMDLEDWWHKKWKHYTRAWPLGQGRLRPFFLPWFIGTDVWPPKNWVRGHPVPKDWEPTHEIKGYAKRAEEAVQNDPLLLRYMGPDWKLPTVQQWFYFCEIEEAKASKALNLKLREMPTTAQEAFQTANTTVFDVEVINDLDANRRPLLGCYGVECLGLPKNFWPEHRDKLHPDDKTKNVKVVAEWASPKMEFQLTPLTTPYYPDPDMCPFENRIFIYEGPQRGFEYFIGVDTAYGLNQDRCAVEVMKKGDPLRPAIQVAEYASGWIDAVNLSYIVAALTTLYSPSTDCKVVIECRGPGDRTQSTLQLWGWGYFHVWEKYDKRHKTKSNTIGWFTNSWSRDNLVVETNKAIKDYDVEINSPWLIHELRTLSKDEMQASIRADSGAHDDRYMAFGMAFFSAHCYDAKIGRAEYTLNQQHRMRNFHEQEHPLDPNADWERRWKAGEHLFDFSLPTPGWEPNPNIVQTVDDIYDSEREFALDPFGDLGYSGPRR